MTMPEIQVLGFPEVARLTGLSKATNHRRYRNDTFPRPLRIGPQSIGWQQSEVLEWVESLSRAGPETDVGTDLDREGQRRPPKSARRRQPCDPQ